jgi:hypothetical protein
LEKDKLGKNQHGHGLDMGLNLKSTSLAQTETGMRWKGQLWNIMYLDKADKVATKGLDKDFGFHINRPFYLVSELPFNRVAECIGASYLRLKRWRNNVTQQQWVFDGKSKTIRSKTWSNYAIQISGNGGSNTIRMTSGINSRWW